MIQQVKVSVTKPDDLNLIPLTCRVVLEGNSLLVPSRWLAQT